MLWIVFSSHQQKTSIYDDHNEDEDEDEDERGAAD